MPSPTTARLIREAAGVSRARLAREIGVHPVTLGRWEDGRFRPSGAQRVAYLALLEQLKELA